MHSKNIIHRNIISDNILCRPNGDIQISNLDCSTILTVEQPTHFKQKGTAAWISPEIAQSVQYGKEVDVWAFGCFAFELAAGYPPFHAHAADMEELFNAIINDNVARIPAKWSNSFADFVAKCLIKNPRERWSFDQLLSHEFMQNAEQAREGWVQDYTSW